MSTEMELSRLRAIGNPVLVVNPQRQQSGNTESTRVVVGVPMEFQNPTNQRAYYVDPMTRRQAHVPAAATTTQGNIANAWRIFMVASIFLCLLFTVVMLICFFVTPDLPPVSVTYVTLDTHNVSTNQIFANWGVEFSITNPNSDHMSFNRVEAFLLSHSNVSSFLSNTTIKPFRVEDTKRVWARFESVWIPVDGLISYDTSNGYDMLSVTNLNVDLHADTKLKPSWKDSLIIQCRNVTVGFSTKETILVGDSDSYECYVVSISSHIVFTIALASFYLMSAVVVVVLVVGVLSLCFVIVYKAFRNRFASRQYI